MREKKRVDDDWKRRAAEEKAKIAGQLGGNRPPTDLGGPSTADSSAAGPGPSPGGDPSSAPSRAPGAGQSPGHATGAPPAGGGRETDPVFVRLISTLGGQSMLALGLTEDPHTGQRYLDLDLARETIDMLGALEARTRGNLSEEEDRLLADVLHQLRLSYTQRVQQAQQAAMNQPPPGAEPGSPGA